MSVESTALENRLRRLIGAADLCSLLSVAFKSPENGELAAGLNDGRFKEDACGCLADAGAGDSAVQEAARALALFEGGNADVLQDKLRKGYSILYMTPGGNTPVWPYEGAFRYAASGHTKAPSLFRSPITLDVEKLMSASGVQMKDARKEPADSIWDEFSYLSFVYGSAAQSLYEGDDEGEKRWLAAAESFKTAHFDAWAASFMEKTIEEAQSGAHSFGEEYAALAKIGLLAIDCLSEGW